MKFEKRNNSYRITKDVNGIRYRVTVDHKPTQREAEELIRKKIEEGVVTTKATDTFNDAVVQYIDSMSHILSPWTINGYRTILRALSDPFKRSKISNIDQPMVQREINRYSDTHSPKSTRNAHGFISAVLKEVKPGLILHTKLPQKEKFQPYTPKEEELKLIFDEVAGTVYEIPFRLAMCGLRRGEICAITSDDVSFDDNNTAFVEISKTKVLSADGQGYIIKPRPKTTDSERKVLIDNDLANKIIECDGEIFPYNPTALRDHLSDIQNKLGLPHFRFHELRAVHATQLRYKGVPDKVILDRLGWKNVSTLDKHYQRTLEGVQVEYKDMILSSLS